MRDAIAAFGVYRSPQMLPAEFTQTLPDRLVFRNPLPAENQTKAMVVKQPGTAGVKFVEPGYDPAQPLVSRIVLIWTFIP